MNFSGTPAHEQDLIERCHGVSVDKGFATFEGRGNLNLMAIRKSNAEGSDRFDDVLVCWLQDDEGLWRCYAWPVTTDPGRYYDKYPIHRDGTAAYVTGKQYRGLWTEGVHGVSRAKKYRYQAWVQVGPADFHRHKPGEERYDPANIQHGVKIAANRHKSNKDGRKVGKYSAACVVNERSRDHDEAMRLGRQQVRMGFGSKFSCSFVESLDVWP